MDLIYVASSSDNPCDTTLGNAGFVCTAWSCNNLLAFTSEKRVKGFSENFIQIVDPNIPWDLHTISCKTGSVRTLQWNQTGTKLLCTDSNGSCYVWTMTNHMTNVWNKKNNLAMDVHGEDILSASWLHNGKIVTFHMDKLEIPNEKFIRAKHKPSVIQFGGQAMEGYIVVTGCGHVVAKVITQDDETVVANGKLDIVDHIEKADISFSDQGNIVIMATDCVIDSPVQFWSVELVYDNDSGKLSMQVNALPGITLNTSVEQLKYDHVSHIKFVSKDNVDHVLISVTGETGSMIESWFMVKDQSPNLHPVLQQMSTSTPDKMARWNLVSKSQHLPKILSMTVPSISVKTSTAASKAIMEHNFYCGLGIGVACADNTIHILHRLGLNTLMAIQVPETLGNPETTLGKRRKNVEYHSRIQHAQFSTTSCALAVFDNHCTLLLYRVAPWLNCKKILGSSLAVRHLAHLFHYCIVTGYEWWDVLLHMQQGMERSICEQLANELGKYPPPKQQMLQSRLLSVKVTLFQAIGSPEAVDCHLRLLFRAITVVFRSLLRPHQDSSDDQAPAEKLREACSASFETDITKLLQCVDTDTHTLQLLQQLIQWVADVTLYLLAIVPRLNIPKTPGVTLLRDKAWLLNLRELLVIIHIWGLLKSACSPVFCSFDDQLNCVPHLFSLVTKVWHAVSTDETRSHMPDDVIDECCLLSNQILIPSLDVTAPVDGILQRLNVVPTPYRFMYGRKVAGTVFANRFSNLDYVKSVDSAEKVDNLRRVFLGTHPVAPLKQCVRCGVISVLNSSPNQSLGFWDQRFIRSCLCGGRWKKSDNKK